MKLNKTPHKDFTAKRQRGVYETPYLTALHMAKLIRPFIRKNSKILDPAVGDGVFVQALLDIDVDPSNIHAFDIDPSVIEKIRDLGINAIQKDTLIDSYGKMDVIIGNPPYKSRRNNLYMKKNHLALKNRYKKIGLYNLYSLFIFNSIEHLNDDGVVCFIVEDAFLTNRYYRRFRQFILDNCKILEIKLAPWRLFHKSKADVRTAIILFQKRRSDSFLFENRNELEKTHLMRLIDRLESEEQYENPPRIQKLPQIDFRRMPDLKFFVGVPKEIIRLVQYTKYRFRDIAEGGTGISTGNDSKYLRSAEKVKGNSDWVGFYKSGQRTPYFYETQYLIEKNYSKNAKSDPKNFLIRNEKYFFREGITCSSVGRRFSAAYLPPGNLFGVNANFFFKDHDDLYYSLGFLNSKLVIFLARKVMNRSNIIATSFLKELPFVLPNKEQKKSVITITKSLVKSFHENPSFDNSNQQKLIDEIIFDVFSISGSSRGEIIDYCENLYERT